MKRYIFAALALSLLGGSAAKADTGKLTATDGWTKITTLPTATDIANNYYVFVDNSNDLMLGVAKGNHQNTKWYSLGVYYQTSVEPTSVDINGKTWILETQGDGFAMRNLEYSVSPFQTEWNDASKFDTNDVYEAPNGWCKISMLFSNNSWTIQNGYYPSSGYLGPWDNVIENGAECAANKTGNNVGKFQIYAINRTQFKQNLLDNASASNPVDLTPWYVTNATFDANNSDGWEISFTSNSSGWWGSHSFGNLGAENYQQVGEAKQTLAVPNGKYKVALQGASNKVSENQAYVFTTHNGSTEKTFFTQSTVSTTDNNKWNDMQYNLLLMMQNRTYGQVQTPEVTVTTRSLTIGYKNENGHSWDVFDNFKLYCTGIDLSAYENQLADLVSECNSFINSNVVPNACETVISNAITQYNKNYETAKEYSSAIVALTAVLNTYKNDTELQAAYADFNSFKTKVMGLTTGQAASTEQTTFNTAVSNATTAVEAATTAAAITDQIPNLRSAAFTYISNVDGQYDITFLASQVYSDWKKTDGSAAGIVADQFLANRPSSIPSFAENFEWTAATTGNVLYQTVSDLPAGYYQVGMYAMALSTSDRDNIATEATEGDADRSFAFAGDQRTGLPIKFATAINFDDLTTLDVNVHLSSTGDLTFGVKKDANGSNWHFAQIASIVYSNSPDLTGLQATRDALVAEAQGLLAGADAAMLTQDQQQALQVAIDEGEAADDFDELNTVTLTTLPNAINTAKQQIAQAKAAIPTMLAALERFENDYNLADGTDYNRVTMSAKAWTDLLGAVNDVSTALDDISQASNYATIAQNLVSQMDATDASLRLFKSYKAMVEGTQALSIAEGTTYAADSYMDTDATELNAIAALNNAFVTYATEQTDDFDVSAFLGENLDFSAAAGSVLNGENSNTIKNVTGWEVEYADADTWAVLQTDQSANNEKLYIRKNWGSSATVLKVSKQKMLPVGKYQLSLDWDSNLENMTNLSCYKLGNASTTIGETTTEAQTLTYDFTVSEPTPFDLVIGFQKTGTGNTPAQIIVDNVTLTYIPTLITLYDNCNDAANNSTTISNNNGVRGVVTLSGRTLYKDGHWNTLCVPFNAELTGDLAGAELKELDVTGKWAMVNGEWTTSDDGHKTGLNGSTLYLNFKTANSITAGTPYIIMWSSGNNVTNPVFTGVTITTDEAAAVESTDGTVTFQGTYSPVILASDQSELYLGADDKLYWPGTENFTVNAFRAYFKLSEAATEARQFVLNFGDEASGINATLNDKGEMINDKVYDLQGRQLSNGKWLNGQMKKGLYINNGKKIIIK